MAKQLNVDMRFNADTSQAQKAINELNASLSKLAYGSMPQNAGIDPAKFQAAAQSARELTYHLNQAYNMKTGNLDLSKLDASLKASGTDLAKLTANFANAGQAGQQAFVALAQSIAAADQPVVSINSKLSMLWTTLKNVARFQISSSIIHGVMGGIQSAYGYAQDLNESLNNIRIVTGQSADQMANFARQANEAAKALSSTTLDYTNASLIYYQQGLSDQEVKERTDVTIKMANVTRDSAESVSSQMTAIWNNFERGGHSLEYFGDVITALGATTASSSAEIARGLEKFAPIAGTIGLSYEKATAALATIVANTRQSADTVGTGLRTVFSRIESLKLGETLEDGVDLNKYTKALQAVGVNVLDANGELKQMDDILDEIAARWEKLNDTQRTTLAQTVGGVRQFTNIMALFNNWDDMMENVATAYGSEGTLQKQADIFAESWEAARNRVKTATQGLYDTLIDDKTFIKLNNIIADLISGLDKFIQGFGGVKTVVITVFSLMASMMADKVGPALQNLINNINVLTGGANKVYQSLTTQTSELIEKNIQTNSYSSIEEQQLRNAGQLLAVRTAYSQVVSKLSAQEKSATDIAIQGIQLQQDNLVKLQQEREKYNEIVKKAEEKINTELYTSSDSKMLKERNAQKNKIFDSNIILSDKEIDASLQQIDDIFNQADSIITKAKEKLLENLKNNTQGGITYQELFPGVVEALNNFENEFETSLNNITVEFKEDSLEFFNDLSDLNIEGFNPDMFREMVESNLDNGKMSGSFAASLLDTIRTLPQEAQEALSPLSDIINNSFSSSIDNIKDKIKLLALSFGEIPEQSQKLQNALMLLQNANSFDDIKNGLEQLKQAFVTGEIPAENYVKTLKALGISSQELNNLDSATKKILELNGAIKEGQKGVKGAIGALDFSHTADGAAALTALASSAGAALAAMRGLKSAADALADPDTSGWEKFTAVLMAFSTTLPAIISLSKNFSTIQSFLSSKLFVTAGAATAEAGAQSADAAATAANAAAHTALNWPLLAVIAAIGALIGIIYLCVKAYNADAIAAKKAAKAAEELSKTSEEANRELENIKNTLDTYDSAVDKLNSCTEGTQEWRDALQEVNNLILDIIAKNPELASMMQFERDANGMYVIANREELLNEAQIRANNAKYAAVMGSASASQAQLTADTTAWIRSQQNDYAMTWASQASTHLQDYSGKTIDELESIFYNQLDDYAKQFDESKDIAHEFAISLYEMVQASDKVTAQLDNSARLIIANNEDLKEADAFTQEYAADLYSDSYNEIYNKVIEDGTKRVNIYSGRNDNQVKDIWARYQKATGTSNNLAGNAVIGTDANRFFQYIDKTNGERKKVSLEEMAAAIAAAEALEKLGTAAATAQESLDNIAEMAPEGTSQFFNQFLSTGNMDGLNLDQAAAIRSAMYEAGGAEAYLKSIYGEQVYNTAIGSEGATRFARQMSGPTMSQAINSVQNADDKALIQAVTSGNLSNLTDEQKAMLGSTEEEIRATMVRLGNTYADIFTQNGLSIGEAAQKAFGHRYDQGIKAALDEASLPQFDIDTWQTEYAEIQKVLSKLNTGDIIDQAAYDKLGEEASQYFMDMHDGNYMLIADAQEYARILRDAKREELGQGRQEQESNWEEKRNSWEGRNLNEMTEAYENSFYRDNRVKDDSQTQAYVESSLGQNANWTNETGEEADRQRYEQLQLAIAANKEYNDTQAMTAQTTSELANVSQKYGTTQEANAKGLLKMAAQYEECHDEIAAYNKAVKENEANSEQAKNAAQKLWKAVRAQEWNKVAKDVSKYVGTLDDVDATADEVDDAAKHIAKSFNDTFDTDISEDWVKANKKLFKEWAEASEEEANDVAEKILNLAKLDSLPKDAKTLSIDLNISEEAASKILSDLDNIKSIIEANPIEVDAYGNADMSNLVQGLFDAGKSAEEVAGILKAIGQTDVSISGVNGQLLSYDLTTATGMQQFINALSSYHGSWQTTGQVPKIGGGSATSNMERVGGKSGGGGGGGGSTKKKDAVKPDASNRYHAIRARQANNEQAIADANRRKERAFGNESIKLARDEIDLLKEKNELQEEYLKEIGDYLVQDTDAMNEAWKALNLGFDLDIDSNGVILNFQQMYDAILQAQQDLVDQYNNGEIDDEKFEELNKQYEEYLDLVDQYEETTDLLEEEKEKQLENLDEVQDKLLELDKQKVEIQIDINTDRMSLIDYLLEKVADDAYKAAEAISLYGDKTAEILEEGNIYTAGINDILSRKGLNIEDLSKYSLEDLKNMGFTQDEIDTLKGYRDNLLEVNNELLEMRSTVVDKVIDAFEELNENVAKAAELFDHYNDVLDKTKSITELMGNRLGGQQKDLLENIQRVQKANLDNRLAAARDSYETAQKAAREAQNAYNLILQTGDEAAIKEQKRILDKANENLREAEQTYLDDWEASLSYAREVYEENITQFWEDLEREQDYLQTQYDRAKEQRDFYLQDYEKLYNLRMLGYDIAKEIDQTSSIKERERLIALQQKMNDLAKDGVQITQYQADALRKEFELEQARAALEDARTEKSEVRLHRDANGRWGYVYTANEDKVAEAEKNYAEKLYQYQKLTDDYLNDLQDRITSIRGDLQGALRDIWDMYEAGDISEEERDKRIKQTAGYYQDLYERLQKELGIDLNNQESVNWLYKALYGPNAEIVDTYGETLISQLMGALNDPDNLPQTIVANVIKTLLDEESKFNKSVDETNSKAKVDTDDFLDTMNKGLSNIEKNSEAAKVEVEDLNKALLNGFSAAINEALKWEAKYSTALDDMITKNENLVATLNDAFYLLSGIKNLAGASISLDSQYNQNLLQKSRDLDTVDTNNALQVINNSINGMFANSFIDLNALDRINAPKTELDQNVVITASFPGVVDHNEIELAFDNLINKASQYANRKNMSSMTYQDMYTNLV